MRIKTGERSNSMHKKPLKVYCTTRNPCNEKCQFNPDHTTPNVQPIWRDMENTNLCKRRRAQ